VGALQNNNYIGSSYKLLSYSFVHVWHFEAVVRNLRSANRVMTMFSFHVSLAPLSVGGCPRASVAGKDPHSDKEASRFLSPRHLLRPTWDDTGMVLFQFLCLIFKRLSFFGWSFLMDGWSWTPSKYFITTSVGKICRQSKVDPYSWDIDWGGLGAKASLRSEPFLEVCGLIVLLKLAHLQTTDSGTNRHETRHASLNHT
jgi:hypothetical protein